MLNENIVEPRSGFTAEFAASHNTSITKMLILTSFWQNF